MSCMAEFVASGSVITSWIEHMAALQLKTCGCPLFLVPFHNPCIITTCSTTHQPVCCCQYGTCLSATYFLSVVSRPLLYWQQTVLAMAYGVVQCATRLAKLQHLQLSSCAALTLSSVRGFPALTSLDLSCCEALLSAAAVSLMHILTQLHQVPHLTRGYKTFIPVIASLDLSCCEALLLAKFRYRHWSKHYV